MKRHGCRGRLDLSPYPTSGRVHTFRAMSRSPARMRAKALVLLLVLLVGGFGLPIVDALWFHSTSGAPASTETGIGSAHESGAAHLLGCAVWSSPATSTGLPCVPATPVIALAQLREPALSSHTVLPSQSDRTLALPRAPPSV